MPVDLHAGIPAQLEVDLDGRHIGSVLCDGHRHLCPGVAGLSRPEGDRPTGGPDEFVKKIAQNVGQTISGQNYCIGFSLGKIRSNVWATSAIFKNLPNGQKFAVVSDLICVCPEKNIFNLRETQILCQTTKIEEAFQIV
jgi:hypothetical protein